MEDIVRAVLDGLAQGDRERVRLLLHPYLHWREPGVALRGRSNVLSRLAAGPTPEPPDEIEVRDGQIYRWTRA